MTPTTLAQELGVPTPLAIQVERRGDIWVARSSYAQKEIVKAAGFRWNPDQRCWWTDKENVALRLADPAALAQKLATDQAAAAINIEESRLADADVELPCPDGLAYLPYQRAGIATALKRTKVLFGDEMGLGKTIQAIGVLNADTSIAKVLILCPASLKLNWARELRKWLTRDLRLGFAEGDCAPIDYCDILIMNYDLADRHVTKLRATKWDAVICDEAHFMKNPEAKRTLAILGKRRTKNDEGTPPIHHRRLMLLTGTPIPNRPVEGFTLFHALGVFQSYWGYRTRYCGGEEKGASNLEELQTKLRASVMIRRLKADVLTELPAKRRSVIELPANGAAFAIAAERQAYEAHESLIEGLRAAVELAKASERKEDYTEAVRSLNEAVRVAFTEISKVRHETARAKVPYVIEHLKSIIENGSKVVCFGHHTDVIDEILAAFPGQSVRVTGQDSIESRQRSVDRFQNDTECMLFVGNIQAAGVGLTLTAAWRVVFAELDWVPGNVTQAEDRCHRIGQRDSVLAEHLVLEGSLDARMATILVEKQAIIEAALDKEIEQPPATPSTETAATASTSRAAIEKEAAKLTPLQIEQIHANLRMLAGRCDGARVLDGSGFSKIDAHIGHLLAQAAFLTPRQAALGAKLCHKYRRQLDRK